MKSKTLAVLGIALAVCTILLGMFMLPLFILKCALGFIFISLGIFILSRNLEGLYNVVE